MCKNKHGGEKAGRGEHGLSLRAAFHSWRTHTLCLHKKNPMQIFVKTLTGRKASFELEPEQTVRCGAGVLWCSWREKPGAPQ